MKTQSEVNWGEYVKALGIVLQRERIQAGLSQESLAHRSGITRTHYQQLEKGSWTASKPANPSLKVVVRIANALGIRPSEVLDQLPPVRIDSETE